MDSQIPSIVEGLYLALVPEPNPDFWPEYLRDHPVRGHGLLSFYQGLKLGIQISAACQEPQ